MNSRTLAASLSLALLLSGCHGTASLPTPANEAASAGRQQETETQRLELQMIPPPSKTRYLAIHSLDSWENPYLTVQPGMVTVHVLQADVNTSQLGAGGMMRPVGARREDLNVSMDKLGEALRSIPHSAWPYGRVAAVEEAHKTPASGELQVRRNMEATMKTLNDLGIVAYEWNESGPK